MGTDSAALASPGRRFVDALARKDTGAMLDLLAPDVDFRAMTPSRFWEGADPEAVLHALRLWFDEGDVIEGVDSVTVDAVSDAEHVGYRLRVRSEGRDHLVAQEAYLTERGGRIGWLRIMCAGYRAVHADDERRVP